jgi:hypothetical protein
MVHVFSNQTPSFGRFWEPLKWKILIDFYDHLVHFVPICFILWQLGISYGHLLYYPDFGTLCKEKSGNPGNSSSAWSLAAKNSFSVQGLFSTTVHLQSLPGDDSRVTRLGEFSPLGRLSTLESVLKITEVAQIFG